MWDLHALAAGVGTHGHGPPLWPLLLALVVLVLILPVAWFFGHGGGTPDDSRQH